MRRSLPTERRYVAPSERAPRFARGSNRKPRLGLAIALVLGAATALAGEADARLRIKGTPPMDLKKPAHTSAATERAPSSRPNRAPDKGLLASRTDLHVKSDLQATVPPPAPPQTLPAAPPPPAAPPVVIPVVANTFQMQMPPPEPQLAVGDGQSRDGTTETHRAGWGIFGPVRIGAMAGVALPRPVSFTALAVIANTVAIGAEYSFAPTFSVQGIEIHASAVSGEARWYVGGTPVFLGASAGVQTLTASGMVQGFAGQGSSSKVFITPRFGLHHTFPIGLSIGADVGVEIPVSTTLAVNPSFAEPLVAANDYVDLLTRRVLPELHIARIGWLF
jgi:hypothetical protein